QVVQEPGRFELDLLDLRMMEGRQRQLAFENRLAADAAYRFDLGGEPPFRACLIRLGDDEYVLSLNVHHIAADGWSARIIVNDICRAYENALLSAKGGVPAPWERGLQYADYSRWEQTWLDGPAYREARAYWVKALDGLPQLHSLPTDFGRSANASVDGNTHVQPLSPTLAAAIERVAKAHQLTPFVVLQAAFAAWLSRYADQDDVVFGTAAANRKPAEFIDTVGLFVNTLVLRFRMSPELCFTEILQMASGINQNALRYQQYPFDALVEDLQPARSLGFNPLVQIMLVMQEDKAGQLQLPDVRVLPLRNRQAVSKFDIALHVAPEDGTLRMEWEYRTDLFRHDTIAAMSASFEYVLSQVLTVPERPLDQVALVAAESVAPGVDLDAFPAPVCIHRLFEQGVVAHPDAPAVVDGGATLSYREMNRRAEGVARYLHLSGAAGRRVGVCMDRSAGLVAAMLGIMKAGSVYVPIDPAYPAERIEFMVQDSAVAVLLVGENKPLPASLQPSVPTAMVESLIDAGGPSGFAFDDVQAPAYIIYTSGSTGRPKGVLVSHRNLFYSLLANGNLMEFTGSDSMPTIGSQAFGVSLLEILLPLTRGGVVQIVRKADGADIARLIDVTNDVTVLHAVPSVMRQWLEVLLSRQGNDYPHLRLLLVGGESVPEGLLRKLREWRPSMRLLELYGMTESTIVCSSFAAIADASAHYCIGKPHPTARFYVMNRRAQLQPVGVPGELYIGGPSIALAYLNQPEMTAERFVANPFVAGDRLYKTGDRVRQLADGNFEFLGRVDHQVSLRGARIEMGEIETLATSVPGVRQVIAHVLELGDEERTLVLYFTRDAAAVAEELIPALRQTLTRHLPDYMRPSIIEAIDAFPLNPNGKVDRKRLPAPRFAQGGDESSPTTNTERRLHALWCEVLQRNELGIDTNFFEAGGHSLMAIKLASRVRSEFGIDFPLLAMFNAPTVRLGAVLIETALRNKHAAALIASDDGASPEAGEEMVF
ncbi:MAG TPA: amino acid adenylation domain-containing protein, partial [Noviherbaspirillum sp.]